MEYIFLLFYINMVQDYPIYQRDKPDRSKVI